MHNTLILFGATGDLAQRYLFPSLLRLFIDGLLPEDFRIRALAPYHSALTTWRF